MSVVLINQSNLNSATLNKYKSSIFSDTHWHKIIVDDIEGMEQVKLLKIIEKFCYPLHFIPVQYKSIGYTASFLMKDCGPLLKKFIDKNLIIPNEYNKNKSFKISIQLCFRRANDLKIDIHNNIKTVLKKRYIQKIGICLDLSNFGSDPKLEEYCPLSQPKLFFYILHVAKEIPFKSLLLASNDIESLKPLEALIDMKSLKSLHLQHNNIKSISELNSLKDLGLTELWLDGNPLCAGLDEHTYVTSIKQILPTIEKVDGVDINQKAELSTRNVFLCSENGCGIVDQFLEHYFTLYDSQNRSALSEIYHQNALFSLTSTFLPAQSTSLTARMFIYNTFSRNLLSLSNLSNKMEFLFYGSSQILKVLTALPPTEHDVSNCSVDLIIHTEKSAIIVVTGIFREISDNLLETDRLLGFSRTFVLLAGQNNEYYIVNDMMHIWNATTNQANKAFKQINVPDARYIYIPKPRTNNEMNEMAIALKTITGLNMEWSHKCLKECKYDLKKAITLFVNLFKVDKIPSSAFDSLPDEDISVTGNQGISEKTNNRPVPPPMKGCQQFEMPPTHIKQISHPILGNISLTSSLGNAIQIPLQNQQQAQNKVGKSKKKQFRHKNNQQYTPSLVNIELKK